MTHNRIAIAIPSSNAEQTIGETLDALQKNTRIGAITKVVVLDDYSRDDGVTVAQKHWQSNVPLEIWRNPHNMGERRTTNAAMLRLAESCDWTFILHADDVVKPDWLSLYIDAIGM